VKYELEFYIPEDGILHSDRREHLKSYILVTASRRVMHVYTHTYFWQKASKTLRAELPVAPHKLSER
jgi:hypothetical protein